MTDWRLVSNYVTSICLKIPWASQNSSLLDLQQKSWNYLDVILKPQLEYGFNTNT